MSTANLQTLPDELFECVVQHLRLDDIRNVRLACRATALKAAQDTYGACFRQKYVLLSRQNLQEFAHITSRSGLGCLIEELTLVGLVYNLDKLQDIIDAGGESIPPRGSRKKTIHKPYTVQQLAAVQQDLGALRRKRQDDELLRDEGNDVVLLSEAFSNIASSKRRRLRCISLRIGIHGRSITTKFSALYGQRLEPILRAAATTFSIAMHGLCMSQLPVHELKIFCNWLDEVNCGLPFGGPELRHFRTDGLSSYLGKLKRLSISVADQTIEDMQTNDDRARSAKPDPKSSNRLRTKDQITDAKNYLGLSEMLQMCRDLEELNLVSYKSHGLKGELGQLQSSMGYKYMYYLAHTIPLARLRKLRLTGFVLHIVDLITFLKSHVESMRDLDLWDITVSTGAFAALASYIAGDQVQLEAIRLDEIKEQQRSVEFEFGRGGARSDDLDSDIVRQWGTEGRRQMSYHCRDHASLGSPHIWEWTLEPQVRHEPVEDVGALAPSTVKF